MEFVFGKSSCYIDILDDLWYYNNSKIKNKKQEFQFAASCPNASKGSGYDKMLDLTLKIMEFEFQII